MDFRQKAQARLQFGIEPLGARWCRFFNGYIWLQSNKPTLWSPRSLLTASGETLRDLDRVAEVGLKDANSLTAVCRRGKLVSARESLVSWRNPQFSITGGLLLFEKGL